VWVKLLQRDQLVVAAREVQVLYESEGLPGEVFVGALRYLRREGKAAVLEQRLVEAATGRPVARAWVLQLLVQRGKVVDWPDAYFSRVAAIEGRRSRSSRGDRPRHGARPTSGVLEQPRQARSRVSSRAEPLDRRAAPRRRSPRP